jgi:hypothetical protein
LLIALLLPIFELLTWNFGSEYLLGSNLLLAAGSVRGGFNVFQKHRRRRPATVNRAPNAKGKGAKREMNTVKFWLEPALISLIFFGKTRSEIGEIKNLSFSINQNMHASPGLK